MKISTRRSVATSKHSGGKPKATTPQHGKTDLFAEAIAVHKKSLIDSINTELTSAEHETKRGLCKLGDEYEGQCRVLEEFEDSLTTFLSSEKLLVSGDNDDVTEITLAQQIAIFKSSVSKKEDELCRLWVELAELRQNLVQLVVEIFGPRAIEERAADVGTPEKQPEAEQKHDELCKVYDDADAEFESIRSNILALVAETTQENRDILHSIETGRKGNMAKVKRAIKALELES